MTWAGYWAPNLVQWILGAAVSAIVGLYVRRMVRIRAAEVDRLVRTVEGLIGGTVATTDPKEPRMFPLDRYRKAVAAGAAVLLTGLLTWVETANLEPVIGPLVPGELRPLVGVALGGIATVAGVILAKNAPKPSEASPTLNEPAPPAAGAPGESEDPEPAGTALTAAEAAPPPVGPTTSAAARRPVSGAAPFWAGVEPGEPQAATSRVELLPPPERDYR